jgi:DNA invertase Pin-like site-specific DNA recombinase
MTARKRRAIGYVRVSTVEQTDGYGLAVQEQRIRDYCRASGLRLLDVERDEGVSGANGLDARQGLATALAALEAGDADVLVVHRLDRLARSFVTQETIVERLCARGREVHSTSQEDVSSTDPERVLVRQILGAIGQYEGAVIRGRMAAGKAVKAARKGYVGGQPRYGTKAEGRALVADPEEAALVERVHALRAAGHSYREVAETLDAEGFRPRRAASWSAMTVRNIAQHPLR